MLSGKIWNDRRLIIFTEYEDTRRWLERRLLEAMDGTDKSDERILVFSGATGTDKRESVKYNRIKSIPVRSVRLQVRTRTFFEEACRFKHVLHGEALIMRNVP